MYFRARIYSAWDMYCKNHETTVTCTILFLLPTYFAQWALYIIPRNVQCTGSDNRSLINVRTIASLREPEK